MNRRSFLAGASAAALCAPVAACAPPTGRLAAWQALAVEPEIVTVMPTMFAAERIELLRIVSEELGVPIRYLDGGFSVYRKPGLPGE
jgi:hypothetical protein